MTEKETKDKSLTAAADAISDVVLAADSAGIADTLLSDETVEAAKNYKKRAPINLTIESEEPKELVHTLSDLKDRALNLQRKDEQGILNESNGAGVVVRKDGQINLASSKYSQRKLSPNGRIVKQAMESVVITNRRKIFTEEIVVNEHKLNPQLWELSDFRTSRLPTNDHAFVGNLCMFGSVLVKAWEPNLKRYMLIRRPWLGPMFGPILNVAEVNPALGINDPLKLEEDILAISDKGYQVNGIMKDAKSLVGKQGEDRSGIIRNQDAMASTGGPGGSSSVGGSSGGTSGNSSWGKGGNNGSYAGAEVGQKTTFLATAYVPDGSELEGGFGTSYGVTLEGKSIASHYMAVNPNIIPYGTVCKLEFPSGWEHLNGEWVAVDTGGDFQDDSENRIDLMFGSGLVEENVNKANEWGRRELVLTKTDRILSVDEAEHWKD